MRLVAKILLVLSVLGGLVLPNQVVSAHEEHCDESGNCGEISIANSGHHPITDPCPPPAECPGEDQHPHDEDGSCPSQHHHHQCVCSISNVPLVSHSDRFLLLPPVVNGRLNARERLFVPESPVNLPYRPPMA